MTVMFVVILKLIQRMFFGNIFNDYQSINKVYFKSDKEF